MAKIVTRNVVYLDSRDLISLLAESAPVSVEELADLLSERDARLVYSFSNIIETVNFGGLDEKTRRLQALASLPNAFILGLPPLLRLEFMQALFAFYGKMRTVPRVDPFRAQWHQTLSHHSLPKFENHTMAEVVLAVLAENPGIGKNTRAKLQEHGCGRTCSSSWNSSKLQMALV